MEKQGKQYERSAAERNLGRKDMGKGRQRILAVCGRKNSGKTSFLVRIVEELAKQGLKAAVIKHDGHDFCCDIEGTDSYRLKAAGAYGTAVFSDSRVFVHKTGTKESVEELIRMFPEADFIFIEGMKESSYPKIEVIREGISSLPISNPEGRFLIVTDRDRMEYEEEAVGFEDMERMIEKILCAGIEKGEYDPMELTHFDTEGNAVMADVTEKAVTDREAVASGRIRVSREVYAAVKNGTAAKGDVLGVARIAGIMGTKQTADLIPLCHVLQITKASVDFRMLEESSEIEAVCRVKAAGKTGVEMEALTGVSAALLTIYDMCKAMDKGMEIHDIRLEKKSGGKSGTYER